MRKEFKIPLIVLSALALANVLFVPIFDVWGGLFPSDVDCNFAWVIEDIFEDSDAWRHWVVVLTMSVFIPTLIVFFMSFTGKKGLFITSNVIGIVLWFKQIIDYGMEDDGFEDLLDFEDGCISIGTWIAIILYLICFFVAISSKKKTETKQEFMPSAIPNTPKIMDGGVAYPPDDIRLHKKPQNYKPTNCPQCGENTSLDTVFCCKCGYKIETYDKKPIGVECYCLSCGSKIDSEQCFCSYCGYKTNKIENNQSVDSKSFCPQCGTPITADMTFCGNCGCKVSEV